MPGPAYLRALEYRKELEDIKNKSNARPWDSRLPTVFWRGAATGLGIESTDWVKTACGQLVLLAARIDDPEVLDAKITKIDHHL